MEDSVVTAASIAHVIQLSVAPVFLLTAIASMLSVLTNRIGRVVDRARQLERDFGSLRGDEWRLQRLRRSLLTLSRRARLISTAIGLCIFSAVLVASVVVTLFLSSLIELRLSSLAAGLFIAAMMTLILALLVFLREIHMATRHLRIGEPEQPATLEPPVLAADEVER